MAIHDAYTLACCGELADTVTGMLQQYSDKRVEVCRDTVLMARHMGQLRIGLLGLPLPHDRDSFEKQVALSPGHVLALPEGGGFESVWGVMEGSLKEEERGFMLRKWVEKKVTPCECS